MSFENFESIDNEIFDNSIIKSDFLKVYHQQGANLNGPDQNVKFIFGELNKYHQIGNAYLQFGLAVRKTDDTNFKDEAIRLINNAFAYTFKELGYLREEDLS